MNLLILNIKHRKMDFSKHLPSEIVQKEFEANPLKILETVRIEKEKELSNKEEPKIEKEIEESINNKKEETKNISPYRDKNNNELEDSKINDFSASFEFKTNETENKKDANRKKSKNENIVNNINNINTSNNINCHNTFINYNPNLNLNNSNNIIVNHLNIFFNFNSNNNNDNSNNDNLFQCNNENIDCNDSNNINNNCNNNKQFCNNNNKINFNDKNNNSNFDQNNNITENNNLFMNNINKLLNNLKSYKGSIICQSYIDSITNKNELSLFLHKIIPHLCQIMCQDYGNYFFQKLIKKLNIQQRLNIYKIIEPEFLVIATNKYGTHSIQSLMDIIETPYEHYALNKLLSKNMLLLFTDEYQNIYF